MRQEIAEWLIVAYRWMLDIALWASLVFPVGFVLSIFRRTRPFTGLILFLFSYLLGAATWLYGAAITFASFGWFGLFVGLVLFGIGVVPMGIIGGFWEGGEFAAMAWGLILLLAATAVFRMVGAWLADEVMTGETAP